MNNLKNYTSTVAAEKSISMIEQLLVKAGASHISKSYDAGRAIGMMFQIEVKGQPITFAIPARIERVEEIFMRGLRQPTPRNKAARKEQAQRTAWKLLWDWVAVQVSLITLDQADAVEVFLPYLWHPGKGQTMYAMLKEQDFNLRMLEEYDQS